MFNSKIVQEIVRTLRLGKYQDDKKPERDFFSSGLVRWVFVFFGLASIVLIIASIISKPKFCENCGSFESNMLLILLWIVLCLGILMAGFCFLSSDVVAKDLRNDLKRYEEKREGLDKSFLARVDMWDPRVVCTISGDKLKDVVDWIHVDDSKAEDLERQEVSVPNKMTILSIGLKWIALTDDGTSLYLCFLTDLFQEVFVIPVEKINFSKIEKVKRSESVYKFALYHQEDETASFWITLRKPSVFKASGKDTFYFLSKGENLLLLLSRLVDTCNEEKKKSAGLI